MHSLPDYEYDTSADCGEFFINVVFDSYYTPSIAKRIALSFCRQSC
jgi:hypothetical protein